MPQACRAQALQEGERLTAALALALLVLYASLAFVARALAQFRRTGSTDFRGISGRPGSPGWLGGMLFVAATGLVLAAPC